MEDKNMHREKNAKELKRLHPLLPLPSNSNGRGFQGQCFPLSSYQFFLTSDVQPVQ